MSTQLTEGKTRGGMCPKKHKSGVGRPIAPPPSPKGLNTKVTKINGRYHCRIIKGGEVYDEMACELKEDVSFCIRSMLRMYDKCGGNSKMASASRMRGKNLSPRGKVWYKNQLPIPKKEYKLKAVCRQCASWTKNPKHGKYKCYTNKCPAKQRDMQSKK